MRISYDYTNLLERFLTDLNQSLITDDEYIYVVRGVEESSYDSNSDDMVKYKPVTDYYLYLDTIEENISYERIKVIHLIDELVTINS
ncbi:MAG TPA: hypothetical protein VK135_05455 [Candidatus Dormibacteraeota bacterium]|nr:hypothetical protein [Candidatus Dormibacteraeota bacterium]